MGKLGVEGYFMNHSLRTICVSRMFQKGAGEDEIMGLTGHCSTGGVHSYKEPSLDQERQLNEMLQLPQKIDNDEGPLEKKIKKEDDIKATYHFSNCNVTFHN